MADALLRQVDELLFRIRYFVRSTNVICLHLEKLDRLPLDESFDFKMYLNRKECLYLGMPSLDLEGRHDQALPDGPGLLDEGPRASGKHADAHSP